MPLSDEDVREILRIIDESELAELQIETEGFSLHVVRGDHGASMESAPRPPAAPTVTSEPQPPPAKPADGLVAVSAPMLGTFYRAEGPGKPPFVEVGSRVEPDTIICIIEVMKMMNSVSAGVAGTVAEILPDNAELVEYGQPLVRVQVQVQPA